MQNLKFLFLITMLLQVVFSQAQINGNGKIISQEIEVNPFEKIHINFPVKVEIDANAQSSLIISADDNILPEILIICKNNKLSILQDNWIEPTKMVTLKIGTKGLTSFEIGGYGNAKIINLKETNFELINMVGKVEMEGEVQNLKFNINTGELDASKLVTQSVNANIWSHGEAIINVIEKLDAEVSENGKLIYLKKPAQLNLNSGRDAEILSLEKSKDQKKNETPVQYVEVTLKNNNFSRIHTYVQGPKIKKFSYGMPFNPKQKRKENYPVGTKIFKVNKIGMRKLLVTISAEDEGKTVNLFKSE